MNMNKRNILNEMYIERNWKKNTKELYTHAIKLYQEYNSMNIEDLLDEAEREEDENIVLKRRSLKKRLIGFRAFLAKNYSIRSYKSIFIKVKTVYNHYDIEIPPLPVLSEKGIKKYDPIYYEDLPDKEIIRQALDIADPLMKAIILLECSSGMGKSEVLSLTIQDFFTACDIEADSVKEGLKILKKDLDIIPAFRLLRIKTNNKYFTFASPESVRYIYYYLMNRLKKTDLSLEDSLFKLHSLTYTRKFESINDSLELGKKGGLNRFRGHMLRKYHASNLMKGQYRLSADEIDSLQGRIQQGSRQSYFFVDINQLKQRYIKCLPNVCVLDNVKNIDIKSEEFIEIEDEFKDLKSKFASLTLKEI